MRVLVLAMAGAALAAHAPAMARVTRLSQTVLQRFDVPGTGYETLFMRVAFPARYQVERHAHPGPESSYVLEGEITFHFDGQEPRTYSAGDSLEVPAYAVHAAWAGAEGVVLLNTFILEKGKPISIAPPQTP